VNLAKAHALLEIAPARMFGRRLPKAQICRADGVQTVPIGQRRAIGRVFSARQLDRDELGP
jgi:hypothetical protein